MRIALLSHSSDVDALGSDGLVDGLSDHARALLELGHEVHVFAAGEAPPAAIDGLHVEVLASRSTLAGALTLDPAHDLARLARGLVEAHAGFAALSRRFEGGEFDVVEIVGDAAAVALVALCGDVPALVRPLGVFAQDGPTAERFAAGRLLRLGLGKARAVSVPSLWLRDDLHRRRLLERHALVIADGIAAVGATPPLAGVVRVWFDASETAARTCVEQLAAIRAAGPELLLAIDGPRRAQAGLAVLRDALGDDRTVSSCRSALALVLCERAPVPPSWLLRAMAAGAPIVAAARGAIPEAIRPEIDGLLFDRFEDLRRPVDRVLHTGSLRDRLANAARRRAAARFAPLDNARRRLQMYEFAAHGRVARVLPTDATEVRLGPDNWFSAWWLAGGGRCATRLNRESLLRLPHAEMKVVEAVLVRSWCEGPADWSAPEWLDLREFGVAVLERCDELRRRGADRDDAAYAELVFPPVDHPMFGAGEDGVLLAEIWRLEGHTGVASWMSEAVARRDFAARAAENVNLRRIAVEAARRTPGIAAFEVLRRVYRDPKRREAVISVDHEFVSRVGADAFARGIADFGLHSPIARTKFPQPRRPRRGTDATATTARITVLIPSFRHEGYIANAIESCLRQSIDDLRVLVADDRSPDRTVEVASTIVDPRLRITVNEHNLGLGASVLEALQKVDTPYVALLNSDDLFHAQRLETCLAVLDADPAAALVATSFAVIDRLGNQLSHATACAAEIGPQAYGWLRWFEAIERDELRTPSDWTSFEVLLRHNVLATSSNMVFRTEWLRAHMPEASRLKYCLDWQLFLQAAMEGSLRVVPEKLLAYRLHDANTVWFREGGRADYVIEVNRVVDRVLVQWLERAAARDGAGVAVEQFATILERAVEQHGETDGLALYLADLARRIAEDAIDGHAAPVVALADAALRRKVNTMVMRQVDVDPWSVPWRVRTADLWRIEHEVAEGFSARARDLERETGQLRIEMESRRREVEDARSLREHQEVESARRDAEQREALSAQKAQAEQAAREFAAARAELVVRLSGSEEQRDEVRARLEATLTERDAEHNSRLAAEARAGELDAELALRAQRIRDAEEIASAQRGEIEDLGRELRAREGEIEVLTRRGTELDQRLVSSEHALAQSQSELRNTDDRLRHTADDLESSRRALRLAQGMLSRAVAGPPARVAASQTEPGILERVGKTLQGATRHGVETLRRARWGTLRALSAAARERRGVTLFDDRIASEGRDARAVAEAVGLAELGPRLFCFASDCPAAHRRAVERELRAARLGAPILLVDDPRLVARDRAYFALRSAEALREVEAALGSEVGFLERVLRAARLCATRGTGLCIAHGLGPAAAMAAAASRLLGVRSVLLLEETDLQDFDLPPPLRAWFLARADAIVVDGEASASRLAVLAPNPSRRVLVRPPAVLPTEAGLPRERKVLALLPQGRGADHAGLIAALRGLLADHADFTFATASSWGRAGELSRLELLARADAAGIGDRFSSMEGPLSAVAAAGCAVWLGRDDAALPRAAWCGLASGRHLVTLDQPSTRALAALGPSVTLVAPGDFAALARALSAAIAAERAEPVSIEVARTRLADLRRDVDRAFTSICQELRGPSTQRR